MAEDLSFISFSASSHPTAFGIYDADPIFQQDADKIVYFVMRNLGSPVLDTELDLRQIWTAFEQATIEYSQTINSAHARNVLLDLLGSTTGSLSGSENIYPMNNSIEFARKWTTQYSTEVGIGGPVKWLTGSVAVTSSVEKYDLFAIVSASLSGTGQDVNKVVFRKVHHYEPTAIYRFFDTTSVVNYLANNVGFESYSPETIFYLLPIWEDVLRGTQLELNQRVRRSNFSFDLKGFELTLFPVPTNNGKIYFEYSISADPTQDVRGHKSHGVMSNLSNVAFGHIGYKDINSIGKSWIYRMTKAMCKEVLGQIRDKYKSIPIPGQEIQLDGSDLISQALQEMDNLRLELRDLLKELNYKSLMQERVELENAILETQKKIPRFIYIV